MNKHIAVIASLWPAPMIAKRIDFKPQGIYNLAACESLDSPATIAIQMATENPYMGHGKSPDTKWDADDIAADLVREWSSGLPGSNIEAGAVPGIWVSEGAKPGGNGDWIIPDEEINFHRQAQDKLLRNLVLIARELARTGNQGQILSVMHKAAEWVKVSGEGWQQELTSGARFKCPVCKTVNEAGAMKCQKCLEVIDPVAYDAYQRGQHKFEHSIEAPDEVPFDPDEREALAVAGETVAVERAATGRRGRVPVSA